MPPPPSMGQSVRAALTKIHMHLPLIKGPLYGTVGGFFFFLLSRERAGGVKIAGFRYGTCFRYGERISTRTRVSGLPGSFSPAAYSLSTTLPCPAILRAVAAAAAATRYVQGYVCTRELWEISPVARSRCRAVAWQVPEYIYIARELCQWTASQPAPCASANQQKEEKAYYVKRN